MARSLDGATHGYLNWDVPAHRERILRRELPAGDLWVFDEIHRYRNWRNYLKGLYDVKRTGQRILVTGSARLDLYRFGGDSLQGRYHLLRMHPLSVAELDLKTTKELLELLTLGGFPEPYWGGSRVEARRWTREHRTLILREEVTSLERVVDLGRLEELMLALPERVGSPLSIDALRGDLQVAHKTVASWLAIFERLYVLFRIAPFVPPRLRAVRKMTKHYHLDWTVVPGDAARFENLVACHLLKWVHFEQDAQGKDLDLRYFRDVHGREVDSVVLNGREPVLLVECKWDDAAIDSNLRYLKSKYTNCDAWQISARGRRDYVTEDGIRVAPALSLLRQWV